MQRSYKPVSTKKILMYGLNRRSRKRINLCLKFQTYHNNLPINDKPNQFKRNHPNLYKRHKTLQNCNQYLNQFNVNSISHMDCMKSSQQLDKETIQPNCLQI